MTKIGLYVIGIIVLISAISGWYFYKQYEAEQRGIAKQIAVELAKSNQRIAERRIRDAKFNKNDARAICEQRNFEWVFSDDKSYCRIK